MCLQGLDAAAKVSGKINGTPLKMAAETSGWWAADVPPAAMRRGGNVLTVAYKNGQAGSIKWVAAELVVRYEKPEAS